MSGTLANTVSFPTRQRWPILALQFGIFFSLLGFNPTPGFGGEGSILRQIGWVALCLICLLGASANSKQWAELKQELAKMRGAIALLLLFLCLALASTFWAEAPFVTFKRAVLLGIVLLICTVATATIRTTATNLAELLLSPLLALLFLSVLFSAALPRIAFTDIGWQGITGHKNEMGQLAAILVLALSHTRWANRRTWLPVAFGIAAGLAALALSRSSTAMVALLAAAAMLTVLRLVRWLRGNRTWAVALYVIFCLAAVALFVAYLGDWLPSFETARSALFEALGKSQNLTGRTKLWDLVMAQDTYRSEILGGGYGGFWDISYERILYVISRLGFRPIQAHNGYLDIFNDLGYVGLGLAIVVLIQYAVFQTARYRVGGESARFHVAFATYFMLANFAESSLLRTTQFLNLLFLVSFLLVAGRRKQSAPQVGQVPKPT